MCEKKNHSHIYISPLGHRLKTSLENVYNYIALCKSGASIAQINAHVYGFPSDWKLINDQAGHGPWKCVSPDGETVNLTVARKFLNDAKQSATGLTVKEWLTNKAKSEVTKSDTGTKRASSRLSSTSTASRETPFSFTATEGSTQTTTSRKSVNGSTTDGLTVVKKNLFDDEYVSRADFDQLKFQNEDLSKELKRLQTMLGDKIEKPPASLESFASALASDEENSVDSFDDEKYVSYSERLKRLGKRTERSPNKSPPVTKKNREVIDLFSSDDESSFDSDSDEEFTQAQRC